MGMCVHAYFPLRCFNSEKKSKGQCHSKPPAVPACSLTRVGKPAVAPSLLNTFTVHEG